MDESQAPDPWDVARAAKQAERTKLIAIEQSLSDIRRGLERARLMAGERVYKSPLIKMEVSAAALDRELLVELQRLND
jgi:hypothetical protein